MRRFWSMWGWTIVRIERTVSCWKSTFMSVGVASLMEASLQNLGTSSVR